MNKRFAKHYITVKNKRYSYFIKPSFEKGCVFFECMAANISQDFLKEDIAALLVDLPELILEEIKYRVEQKQIIRFRVSVQDKYLIEKKAVQHGYSTVSGFLRDLALNS